MKCYGGVSVWWLYQIFCGNIWAVNILPSVLMPHLPLSRNVLRSGFEHSVVLPSSQSCDSVLCSVVADVNWDGRNEIILGTYGKVSYNWRDKLVVFILICTKVCSNWSNQIAQFAVDIFYTHLLGGE